MFGMPPNAHSPTKAPSKEGTSDRTHWTWALVLSALGMAVIAALFLAPGVIDLSVLVLGLVLLGAFLVRPHGSSLRAGSLVFLLVAIVTTSSVKAAWLVNNLPSPNDHSSPLPYPFVAAVAPLAVLIASFSVRRSSLSLTNKVIRVATIGLLAGFLPWLFLVMTGVAD